MKLHHLMACGLLGLVSCSARVVEVGRPVLLEQRVERHDTVAAVALVRDSVHVRERGDSVIVTRQKTIFVDRWHHAVHTDTIQVPVVVQRTEKVPQPLKLWHRLCIIWGIASLLLAVGKALQAILKLFFRVK